MQRSRLKNIINKSKTISNKQEVGNSFDEFKKSLPIEVDDNYRLESAWKAYGSPKNYKEALWQGLIQPIDENNYKLPSIGYNEETDEYEYLNKGEDNETVAKDIRVWDNDVIPLVQELKLGGYVRTFNKEKDCWTYTKNSQKENTLDQNQVNIQKEQSGELIDSFQNGGKTSKNNEKQIKERLFKEWPVLSNIEFHIVPDSNFTVKNTGVGSIEYFSPEEKEYMFYPNGFKYKNPYLGEASIVYNPNDNDYEDIKMDLLHALRVQDPKYKALINEIDKAVLEGDDDLKSNARLRYDEDLKKYGKEYMPFENYVQNEVDGLLRNLFYNGSSEILKSKRYYPNKENLKKWNKHLMPYIQKIEAYLNGTQAFKQGGQMNVIPEGALHARKNNMELAKEGEVTSKGIPVVSKGENGEIIQHAEVEKEELTVTKEVTNKLESWYKKFFDENTSQSDKDEIAIKCGKYITKEILFNTEDRVGLISKLQENGITS